MIALTSGVTYWKFRNSAKGSVHIHTIKNLCAGMAQ